MTRALVIAAALLSSWFGMQAVHELGHVLGAWLTGGKVQRVVLHPLMFSRTDVSPNPKPLAVAWTGPVVGATFPLIAVVAFRRRKGPLKSCAEFFAGFCLIANGAYIGAGALLGVGDAGDLLRHGSPLWLLMAFGIICSAAGLWLWHRLTKRRSSS
jgi:hypothetical protein